MMQLRLFSIKSEYSTPWSILGHSSCLFGSVLTVLKSILCVWACLQLVLPGCLCQVLEPLGIDVPRHHHATSILSEDRGPCRLCPLPIIGSDPSIPCHCDERPDRTTDETIASVERESPSEESLPWELLIIHDRFLRPLTVSGNPASSRAPPVGLRAAEELRIARCVHLL